MSLRVRRCDKKAQQFNINAIKLKKPAHDMPCLGGRFFKRHAYLEPIKKWAPNESLPVDLLLDFNYANLMATDFY